ncbi:hypothetical protein QQX98_007639 [Neonectria punicea]|uniref:AAA+ ATPase domain-containing protein n=1 Tax=Neonectria punicea TaxID=979145 RepID=A0ABR1GYL0_9HYPO
MAGPLDFLDELVKALAKDIGTSLISFDLEDLEDLGLEFSLQTLADSPGSRSPSDNLKDKNTAFFPSLAKHWFASSSDTGVKPEGWERSQMIYSTLLDAIANEDPVGSLHDGVATEKTHEDPQPHPKSSSGPILVHLGQRQKTEADLRQRLRHVFAPEILHPHSDWNQLICKESGQCFGKKMWSWDDIRRAFLGISGRSWGKEQLEASDILLVLSRLGLHKHYKPAVANGQKPQEDAVEEVEKKKEESVKAEKQTWEGKMTNLRQACNSAKKGLLSCVIDPDKIQSSYSQVILDEDLKETVLHLVSSSYLGPVTPSTSLLSRTRIRGILLYGPPGTGKTHLARSIAKESGAPMVCVDGASLLSKYVGGSEKSIKAAFTLASKLFPCVLFIDEVDSLFYDRQTAKRSWERSAVTQFLTQMDGLAQNDKAPCVIVATNRPDVLDKAFLRRLPQKIPVGLPDQVSRSKILEILLEGEELEPLVSIESLARETEGYSGSDLRSLCAEAAPIWAIEHSKRGRENGFSDASGKMLLGLAHFAKALQRIRPSVAKRDLLDLESFTKIFNPYPVG